MSRCGNGLAFDCDPTRAAVDAGLAGPSLGAHPASALAAVRIMTLQPPERLQLDDLEGELVRPVRVFIAVEIAPAATVLMASDAGSELAAIEPAGVIHVELPRVGGSGYPAASIR